MAEIDCKHWVDIIQAEIDADVAALEAIDEGYEMDYYIDYGEWSGASYNRMAEPYQERILANTELLGWEPFYLDTVLGVDA